MKVMFEVADFSYKLINANASVKEYLTFFFFIILLLDNGNNRQHRFFCGSSQVD